MKKAFQFLGVMFSIMFLYTLLLNSQEMRRLYHLYFLFEEDNISENFRNMQGFFSTRAIPSSETTSDLNLGTDLNYQLPESFEFKTHQVSSDYFLRYTNTRALLVLHNNKLIFEQYYGSASKDDLHISWSISKSVLSILTGIAIAEGKLELDDLAASYVPELKQTGFKDTSVEQLLQMTSGIVFSEDYDDFWSDINIFSYYLSLGFSLSDYVKTLKQNDHPGEHRYASIETQVLAMVLSRATGKSISDYLSEKIWSPLGMEKSALWITDASGMEFAPGGLNATARDLARFATLITRNGLVNKQQLVPAEWINKIGSANNIVSSDDYHTYDYSYRWWIPQNSSENEMLAIGVYDQYIYINRAKNIIVVKLSANANYIKDNYISEDQSLALFREITKSFQIVPLK